LPLKPCDPADRRRSTHPPESISASVCSSGRPLHQIIGSGQLYTHFGAQGFWVMAALCAATLPLARNLREPNSKAG